MPSDDYGACSDPFQSTHRTESSLEPTVIRFDRIVRVPLHAGAGIGHHLVEHQRVDRRPIRSHLGRTWRFRQRVGEESASSRDHIRREPEACKPRPIRHRRPSTRRRHRPSLTSRPTRRLMQQSLARCAATAVRGMARSAPGEGQLDAGEPGPGAEPFSLGTFANPRKWPLRTCPALASSAASENGLSTSATPGSSLPWEARTGWA